MATVRQRLPYPYGRQFTYRTYEVLTPALATWLLDEHWRRRP
jgi:hypothetical protein